MAMLAPFLKSAVVDLDGGRNGSPNLLPAEREEEESHHRQRQRQHHPPIQSIRHNGCQIVKEIERVTY
jgi:hypothetical protein